MFDSFILFGAVFAALLFILFFVFKTRVWFRFFVVYTLCLVLVVVSGFLGALLKYQVQGFQKKVATITVQEQTPKRYMLKLSASMASGSYLVYGDEFELDARLIVWNDLIAWWLDGPSLRWDRLGGRRLPYESHQGPSSHYLLYQEQVLGADVWWWLSKLGLGSILVDLKYGSSVYGPMAHSAQYEVWLNDRSLELRAVNQIAKDALDRWE